MTYIRFTLTVFFTFLIQACGGGGSDSNSGGSASTGSTYTFSMQSVLISDCGVEVPFTQLELLLQGQDWQWQKTYTPDENGLISFSTTDKNINFTLVAKTQKDDENETLDIVSYYQASSTKATRYVATYDHLNTNDTCECITQNVQLRHRAFASVIEVASSLSYESLQQQSPQSTLFENVRACRVIDGEWPLASFMINGTDDDDNIIGVADFLTDFSVTTDGIWSLSAVEVAQEVSLSKKHQAMSFAQIFANATHFASNIAKDAKSVLVFNSHAYINEAVYKTQTSYNLSEKTTVFGSSSVDSNHQLISTTYADVLSNDSSDNMPNIDDENFSELADDGSYDYSAVKNYPMAIISFTYGFDAVAKWTMYGPAEGMLPSSQSLVGYEDIVNSDTYVKQTEVVLLKSASSSQYANYVQYYQNPSDGDFINDLSRYVLDITLQ